MPQNATWPCHNAGHCAPHRPCHVPGVQTAARRRWYFRGQRCRRVTSRTRRLSSQGSEIRPVHKGRWHSHAHVSHRSDPWPGTDSPKAQHVHESALASFSAGLGAAEPVTQVHVHMHAHARTGTHMHTCVHTHAHARVDRHTRVHVHAYTCTCTRTCVPMWTGLTCTCICVHKHCTHVCAHTHVRGHTHTFPQGPTPPR